LSEAARAAKNAAAAIITAAWMARRRRQRTQSLLTQSVRNQPHIEKLAAEAFNNGGGSDGRSTDKVLPSSGADRRRPELRLWLLAAIVPWQRPGSSRTIAPPPLPWQPD
jgi:hypothetical protein